MLQCQYVQFGIRLYLHFETSSGATRKYLSSSFRPIMIPIKGNTLILTLVKNHVESVHLF